MSIILQKNEFLEKRGDYSAMRIVLYAFDHIEYTIQLAEALSKMEEVMLILPQHKADWFTEVLGDELNMESYRQPRLRYPTNLLTLYWIIKKINGFGPDIVHLQGEHPWLNLMLPFLRRKYPLVITVHDVVLHVGDTKSRKIPSFVHKLSIKNADEIIVHGHKLKKEMMGKSDKLDSNVHILPRGINSIYRRFLQNEMEEEDNSILFFGRIWEYKGLRYLIEAEPFITEKVPMAKIVIAGKGEDFGKYKRMMVHKEKFIVHNRLIPSNMVGQLFQKASVVVVPYIEASQSGIVPLAYAFKKPVVATSVGSIPEVVEDGITGHLVPPRDPQKLAGAIIDLLKNKEKRRKMGENAYRKAEEELSWDDIAAKTIEIYKKALLDRQRNSH